MENQELLDEEIIASEDIETNDNEEGEGEENNASPNKNQSNFKALYKANKEKEALLKEKEEQLANALAELEEWRRLNPEVSEDLKGKKDLSSIEDRIFWIENPDAKPYLKEIKATMKEYWVDYDKAWKLVKIDLPEESKSKRDFDIWSKAPAKAKDFTKVTAEEALKLSKEDRAKWRQANWWE